MSTGELLDIDPLELKFPFELKKQISCSLQLSNKTDNYVAFKVNFDSPLPKKNMIQDLSTVNFLPYILFILIFKLMFVFGIKLFAVVQVKTTNPKKYCVRPNTGIVMPRSTCDVIVTMQAQREAPSDMQCKDKFLLQSVITSPGATQKDITAEMFNKEAGHNVEECKLRVVYVAPPQPPSPVAEGSEEGNSPRASMSENGASNSLEFSAVSISTSRNTFNFRLFFVDCNNNLSLNPKIWGRPWLFFVDCFILMVRLHNDTCRFNEHWLRLWRNHLMCVNLTLMVNLPALLLAVLDSIDGIEVLIMQALITKLTDEKNSAIQQSNKLRQELDLLRREGIKSRRGVSFLFVVFVGLVGIIMGYFVKTN
ncbi:Major sperm protein (MSP) domain [Dillenia turbinata]|uniref:Major sperm protein (MSP) domain n=1 Tax=Dillenia turbinata TaxID=194707 RepID=A0AAN8W7W1_9MAGN